MPLCLQFATFSYFFVLRMINSPTMNVLVCLVLISVLSLVLRLDMQQALPGSGKGYAATFSFGIGVNYILRRSFRVLVENYILWGFFRGNGGELYSEGFFREFGGKSNSLGDFSLDWRKIIFF